MPPLQFAQVNGVRIGYYETGPASDAPPLILCHGWPEIAFSWRHQLKGLSEAGLRVFAPDQRGYGASDRPEAVEAYDYGTLTDDLVGLLDRLGIQKAIFVGHDMGGFVVWEMAMRHPTRVAGVVGVNTPHRRRTRIDPIQIFRQHFGDSMYIVQFQAPGREPDQIFARNVGKFFDFMIRGPAPPKTSADVAPTRLNLAFPQIVAAYDPARDGRKRLLTPEEMQVYVETFRRTGFTGGINWYRNWTRNWENAEHLNHVISVPSLMIMAELDAVLPPSYADGMEALVPDLEKHLVRGSGHWTQQEYPDEVNATILDWRRRRFG